VVVVAVLGVVELGITERSCDPLHPTTRTRNARRTTVLGMARRHRSDV